MDPRFCSWLRRIAFLDNLPLFCLCVAAKLGAGVDADLTFGPTGEFSLFGRGNVDRERLFGFGCKFEVEESYQSTSLNWSFLALWPLRLLLDLSGRA